jgi:ATP-binding protein involved in chromosome partitioning
MSDIIVLQLEGLEPELSPDNRLVPLTSYGIKTMSMGFLVPQDSPIAWRGLMVQKAMNQLLFEVAWPHLDLLILDLPPGTGDVQLTIAQSVALNGKSHDRWSDRDNADSVSGAIIVSTPQDLALRDAARGFDFFQKVNVPVLGMVQNMSTFTCTKCGHNHDIFGLDGMMCRWYNDVPSADWLIGARKWCATKKVALLGDVPLHAQICHDADAGKPTVVTSPDGSQAQAFHGIMKSVTAAVGLLWTLGIEHNLPREEQNWPANYMEILPVKWSDLHHWG